MAMCHEPPSPPSFCHVRQVAHHEELFPPHTIVSRYLSVQLLPLSDATVLSFLSPLCVAVLGPVTISEWPPRLVWGLIPVCLVGVLLVAQPSFLFGAGAVALSTIGIICAMAQVRRVAGLRCSRVCAG